MKVREIVALLEADGWRLVRIRGNHHHYKLPAKPTVSE
jgi:predicted RNA binding protein YcfA (HicA-like mRNA interferase family)